MKTNNHQKGLTLIELLVTLGIFALILALGVPGFNAFFKRAEIDVAVRTVTSALQTARHQAIERNKRVKVTLEDNKLVLKETHYDLWQPFMEFDPGDKANLSLNASPVFSPEGYIAPLCSVFVDSETFHYQVTISMAGRIKVQKR